MNLKKYNILFIISILLFISCSDNKMKTTATGEVSEIAICAPLTVYAPIEKTLLENLYEEVFLPVRESVFKTRYIPLKQLHIYKRSKNLLFILNVNRDDEYSRIIKGFLSEENREKVKESGVLMFNIFDGFADGQNILIIAGISEELIKKFISINGKKIRKFYMDNAPRSIEKMVYFTGFNEKVQNEIKKYLNINIKIPSDYVKSFYDKEMNVYSAISHYPERVITICVMNKELKTLDDIISLRNEIGKKHWNNDYIDTVNVKLSIDTIDIAGDKAMQIIGVWSNDEFEYGGPFIMLIKKEQDRYIILDGHIYSPGKRKYFKLMETKTILMSVYND